MIGNAQLTQLREKYISLAEDKITHHSRNGINALSWDSGLSTMNVIFTSCMAFTLTLLTVFSVGSTAITIVSASYGLVISITSKVQTNYNFQLLNVKHLNAEDDYQEIKHRLSNCKTEEELSNCIKEYTNIESKSHITEIRMCPLKCYR